MSQDIIITNKHEIVPKHKAEHERYEYIKYEVTERKAENQCYVCVYEIPPQKAAYPYHYHTANTEVFYIISGNGIIETPDGIKSITTGDVIVCPRDEKSAHRITNTSETEVLTYLDCSTLNTPDVVFYPHTGKLGTLVNGKAGHFFKTDSQVDYYKGE